MAGEGGPVNWPQTIATVAAIVLAINLIASWAGIRAWWSHRREMRDRNWATSWQQVEQRRRSW